MTLPLENILNQYRQQRAEAEAEANARHQAERQAAINEYERVVPADLRSILTNPIFTYDEGEIIARQTINIEGIPVSVWICTFPDYTQPTDDFGIPEGPELPPIFIAVGQPDKGYAYKRRLDLGDGDFANWPLKLGEMLHYQIRYMREYKPTDAPQTATAATNHAIESVGLLNLAAQIENEKTSAYVATVALANAAVAQLEQSRRIADALEQLNNIDSGPLARIALLTEKIAAASEKLSRATHSYNGSGYINVRSGRI